jgi:hypothetical protein
MDRETEQIFDEAIAEDKENGTEPQDWYFTFGYDHTDHAGQPLRNRYMKFHGTFNEARKQIYMLRGNAWSNQYPWEHFERQVERFGLTEYTVTQG